MKILVRVFSAVFLLFGLLTIIPQQPLAENKLDFSEQAEKSLSSKQDIETGQTQKIMEGQESGLENLISDMFKQQIENTFKKKHREAEAGVVNIKNDLFNSSKPFDSEFNRIEKVLFAENYTIQKNVKASESYTDQQRQKNTMKFISSGLVITAICVGIYLMLKKWLG